jgi:hypothetical protein
VSPKQGNESLHDISGEITHLLEMYKNRLTLENFRLAEGYIKGQFHILVKFMVSADSQDYIALLRANVPDCANHVLKPDNQRSVWRNFKSWCDLDVWVADPETEYRDGTNTSQYFSVLVNDVEMMKGPKFVVRSLVRLEKADSFSSFLPQEWLYFSTKQVFKSISGLGNRKSDHCEFLGIGNAVGAGKLIDEVIPRTSDAMDGIPDDKRELGQNWPELDQMIFRNLGLSIVLGNRFIGFSCEEGIPFPLELTEVMFGPFNFGVNENKSCIANAAHYEPSVSGILRDIKG